MPVLNPCWPSQLKKFPWTTTEVANLWRLAKEHYIDPQFQINGQMRHLTYDEVVERMAHDLGMNPYHIAQGFQEPKVVRNISNQMWSKMARQREMIQQSKALVETYGYPKLFKALKTIYDTPRALLVRGHGGVFPITHMGKYAFVPTQWDIFFRTATNAWKFFGKAGEARYEIALREHFSKTDNMGNNLYEIARRASPSVDPGQASVGILGSMKGWSMRGFNTLKIARLDLFERQWNKLDAVDRTGKLGEQNAKTIMNYINHATGEVDLGKASPYMAQFFFAPKLWPARIMDAIVDPVRAIGIVARKMSGAEVSAGELQAARMVMGHGAQVIASYYTLMQVNNGLNKWVFGSDERTNISDFTKGDIGSFKLGGLTLRPPNSIIEVLRLTGGMVMAGLAPRAKLHGETRTSAALNVARDYINYKLHPTIRTAAEAVTGEDLFGRPIMLNIPGTDKHIPSVAELITGEAPQESPRRPEVHTVEFLAGKGPIPVGGAAREFYQNLRDEGLSHMDAKAWIQTAVTLAGEGEGIMVHSAKTSPPASSTYETGAPMLSLPPIPPPAP